VENVDDFEADNWGGHSLNVSENYRSYGEILDVAHFAIIQDEKFMSQSDSIKLEPAKLGMAEEPRVILYEANSKESEADFVAQEIVGLLKKGVELEEIAILMRGLRSVRLYEDALRRAQVPYRTTGGTGFYDRQEIRDILAYLMVIDNPFDEQALIRVLKRPPVGLNDLSLYKLSARKKKDVQLFDVLNQADEILDDKEAVRRIKKFLHLMAEMWKVIGEGGIFYIASQLVERSGYLKYVHGMPGDARERSLANIRKLLRMASEFERRNIFSNLKDFVQHVQFSMDEPVIESEAESELGSKAVQIMSIHQAKGLEFDVVFVVNVRKPSFPSTARHPMFAFHDTDGLIINTDRDGDKFFKYRPYDLKKNSHLYQKHGIIDHYEQFRNDHLAEERRIWYVAMTRARQLLHLTRVAAESVRGNKKDDFFEEIRAGFAEMNKICQFRSFRDVDENDEAELPLWKGKDESAFKSVEEAEEFEERLMELLSSRKSKS
jgi:superfamily I DNA/RNA helicase